MVQYEFAQKVKRTFEPDDNVIGLAVGGSWLTNEIDEFSDVDLILVTRTKISNDKNLMINYAKRIGNYLSGFTGEHVGEPRVLICLFDDPLLHVDIKFVTLDEYKVQVETPNILLDKSGQLQSINENTIANFPVPDFQWIEDRFWTWIHYALLKIGRGEYFEALDFLGFLRMVVLGPLLHIKNGNLPRGVRKVEMELNNKDLDNLKSTIANYNKQSLLESLYKSVTIYKQARNELYNSSIVLHKKTEERVMHYFDVIKNTK